MSELPVTDIGGAQPNAFRLLLPGVERRQMSAAHYNHNAITHTSDGNTYSRDPVIAASARRLAAFPDLHLYARGIRSVEAWAMRMPA
jgi:hypothetical protein